MDVKELFDNFQTVDLQWFVPVLGGLAVIVVSLLVGLFRGMTAGVIVAILFGGLMSMSPILLNALQHREDTRVDRASASVARGAAELAALNNEAVLDISRVIATLRNALDGLGPLLRAPEDTDTTEEVARFTQSLTDIEDRLDSAISSLSRANLLRQRLEEEIQTLEAELDRAPGSR
ncbi:hypothetical protein [Acuticoccus kandeliae]|uniref:hypothetical protein n=1 Tax=Acuticoccus kandeliae TaxID=2073160 RepID=UPI000D3ECAB3|nr:hypothetical protein [Acuticoccus kandeliae]